MKGLHRAEDTFEEEEQRRARYEKVEGWYKNAVGAEEVFRQEVEHLKDLHRRLTLRGETERARGTADAIAQAQTQLAVARERQDKYLRMLRGDEELLTAEIGAGPEVENQESKELDRTPFFLALNSGTLTLTGKKDDSDKAPGQRKRRGKPKRRRPAQSKRKSTSSAAEEPKRRQRNAYEREVLADKIKEEYWTEKDKGQMTRLDVFEFLAKKSKKLFREQLTSGQIRGRFQRARGDRRK